MGELLRLVVDDHFGAQPRLQLSSCHGRKPEDGRAAAHNGMRRRTRHESTTTSERNWDFDERTITVRIPIPSVRRGGRKVIIAPSGGDAWTPAKPRSDETLIRALARAHRWKRMLEEKRYRSAGELANAEGVTRSFVNRLLRLTLLAPDIQEAILEAGQSKGEFTWAMPSGWHVQRKPESLGDRM